MTILTTTKFFAFISILFFASSAYSQSVYTLQKGTQIRVRMDNEINSKVSSVNDTFTTTLAAPLIIRETEVLPIGTVIEGRIVNVRRASLGRKPGSFEVKFEMLRLPNGAKRPIMASLNDSASPLLKDKSETTLDAATIGGGTILGGIFGTLASKSKGALIGAGVGLATGTAAVFLQKGKEAKIKADAEISILLKQEVTLPVEDF